MEEASDLQALRTRLVNSALEQRRQIERTLHDGPQQDLIGISVQLQLVRNLLAGTSEEAAAALEEVQRETRDALERVRTLAAEIYPAGLESLGLAAALRQAAAGSRAAARVDAAGLGRHSASVETAVFFLWQSVLRGLDPDSEALIAVREVDAMLEVEVTVEGPVDVDRARDLVEGGAGGALTITDSPRPRISATIPLVD